MATLGSLVDEVLQIVKGYGLYQPRGSYLTAGIDADDLTITVRDASSLDQGVAELGGDELVLISDERGQAAAIAPAMRSLVSPVIVLAISPTRRFSSST